MKKKKIFNLNRCKGKGEDKVRNGYWRKKQNVMIPNLDSSSVKLKVKSAAEEEEEGQPL